MITLEILKNPIPQDLKDVNALLTQIAEKPHLLSRRELKRVTGQESCFLIVARDKVAGGSKIVAMSAVTLVYISTGLISMIEDVVVDEEYRGRGIGKKLTQKMIALAKQKRAKHISLITNPARVAANAMYSKMGFFKKDTNYYRINLYLPKPADSKSLAKVLKYRSLKK